MSKAEDMVPPSPPATTEDSFVVTTVFTAVSLPMPTSLGLSLQVEMIQQITEAVGGIFATKFVKWQQENFWVLPPAQGLPIRSLMRKCSVKLHTFVHLCVGF